MENKTQVRNARVQSQEPQRMVYIFSIEPVLPNWLIKKLASLSGLGILMMPAHWPWLFATE